YYINNIIMWQLVYYAIIIYYLWLKIQSIIQRLVAFDNSIQSILQIMRKLNDIFTEIDDYNRFYWQYFLAIYWTLITVFIAVFLFVTFYGSIVFIVKMYIFFIAIVFLLN